MSPPAQQRAEALLQTRRGKCEDCAAARGPDGAARHPYPGRESATSRIWLEFRPLAPHSFDAITERRVSVAIPAQCVGYDQDIGANNLELGKFDMTKLPKLSGGLGLTILAAILPLLSLTAQAQNSITNGLVAYWSFDGNLYDSIKNFHGTARGTLPIPYVDGKAGFGKAIKLNGDNQFVEITGGNENELEFPGASMSIAGWFKVDTFDTSWQALISKGEGSNYRVARRGAEAGIAYAGGTTDTPSGTPVDDGAWHQFVAVSELGVNTRLYVDGNLDSQFDTPPVLAASAFLLRIGDNPGAPGREWEGELDDFAIWRRVVTEAEITALYAGGPGKAISSLLPPLNGGRVTIDKQPASVSVAAPSVAVFTVAATTTGTFPIEYQWRKNGADIAGANSLSYTTPFVSIADNGAKYSVRVSVPGTNVISADATLTVTVDTAPPIIVSAEGSPTYDRLTLHFDGPLDNASATALANYSIDGGLTLSAPVLQNQKDVVLMTTKQASGRQYTVTVSNVKDTSGNVIVASTKASFNAYTVTTGLVAYWSFDGNFLDSIKDFHGTARGTDPIPFVDGKAGFGKAIKLNGENQFVEITGGNENELEFPGASMSISGWFKVDAFDTSWQAIISKGEGSNYRVARRGTESGIAYAGGTTDTPSGTPVDDGAWHHFVAVTEQGVNTRLYLDGNLDSQFDTPPVLASSAFPLMIGENPGARNREWEGELDDFGIWNRVLNEDEIATLFATGAGKALSALLPPPNVPIRTSVTKTGNTLTIQWSPTGGTLESTTALGPTAVWTTVGTANPATVTLGAGNRFYRIRK
jgi:hypothetical protein